MAMRALKINLRKSILCDLKSVAEKVQAGILELLKDRKRKTRIRIRRAMGFEKPVSIDENLLVGSRSAHIYSTMQCSTYKYNAQNVEKGFTRTRSTNNLDFSTRKCNIQSAPK